MLNSAPVSSEFRDSVLVADTSLDLHNSPPTAMSPTASTVIRALCALFAGALVLQSASVLVCLAPMLANDLAGFMRYRVPRLLFWIYVWIGLGAPASALVTAAVLWARRGSLRNGISPADERALRRLKVLCAANVVAIVLWLPFGGVVLFSTGGRC